ncbi:MAG TPA: hypothetical protein VEK08_09280 [Planctomycetota bacterium]|nr:hypothetical protein [Planctomycetota bacterium]
MRLTCTLILAMLATAAANAGDAAPINPKSLSPGLVATYRSPEGATVSRIEPKPAFSFGNSSPHPRLPSGVFSASFEGVIVLRGDAPFLFDAFVGGELTVKIDGDEVLKGRGESESAQVRSEQSLVRRAGRYRISIDYRSLANVPARLQLWWQGATFSREPIPAWVFKHVPQEIPETVRLDSLAMEGRNAASRLGCAQCHAGAFPALQDAPPGPSLSGLGARVSREWLVSFLNNPAEAHPAARMPSLFKPDRDGAIERRLIADFLLTENSAKAAVTPAGDHRRGRKLYLSIGCVACHYDLETRREEQKVVDRISFDGLADRLPAAQLAEFLKNPIVRYPDGRHPQFALSAEAARDLAAYLLLWCKQQAAPATREAPVSDAELDAAVKRLGAPDKSGAAISLLRTKGCAACHAGLPQAEKQMIPLTPEKVAGCLSDSGSVRFKLDESTRKALVAYTSVSTRERHASPVEDRRLLIGRLGCFRCHSVDDRPPPLEEASASVGGAFLQTVPFLRTPRLNNALAKYTREYLSSALRQGVSGVRYKSYSFVMPHYGAHVESIIQALAEMDGDVVSPPSAAKKETDPTLTGPGASLVGFEGYSCVSCHTWNGAQLNEGDPGAVGPDLTTTTQRIRRDWFDRWMDEPARIVPGTVMPQIFTHGQPATIKSVLDGDVARQKEAIWAYLSLGKEAPSPKPLPAVPVDIPPAGAPPLVAQIPIRLPDKANVESICVAYGSHDLLVYDIGALKLRGAYSGAQILRNVRGRTRTFSLAGVALTEFTASSAIDALTSPPQAVELLGYERLADGARIKLLARYAEKSIEGSETFRVTARKLTHEIQWSGLPVKSVTHDLKNVASPPPTNYPQLPDPGPIGGSLERPGYRAIVYPRPKTVTGEDLLMPGAVAVHPIDGRVFVASMKNGELFVLRDQADDGKGAQFENYAGGLFQEVYAMLAEKDGLYVLHRRNVTRITETGGRATNFERVFALPHGIAETYDYGYGLVRDKTGALVISFAPYANRKLPGSGSAIRLIPGEKPEEIAFGFRNPLGWCNGPDSEIFYTDNQGEWVATNKLCHVVKGRYYGFPNPDQKEHATKPPGKTALWVPYAWGRSINGVTYNSGEKFGPFKGQFFLAELMYGGAIIRASLEKVNGEYQGACFPFWGKGLLGPLTLAFDPRGRLFVGSITEPGWMAQPDRGALFRIDFTGQTPFEIHSINVRPQGFRLNFTQAVDAKLAGLPESYAIEHYRYEYTGSYGSPELDRMPLSIEKIAVAADGRSVEIRTGALIRDRVYMIGAAGVKSATGDALVNPHAAYTLNEIPVP